MAQITVVTVGKDGGESTSKVVDSFEELLPATVHDGPKFSGTDVCVENLFNYIDDDWNLYTFLKYFPSVSKEQALAALNERVREDAAEALHSVKGTVGGTPKFVGTRVMIYIMFDILAHGGNLDEFLVDYPGISREQAVKTLEVAKRALELIAYENPGG